MTKIIVFILFLSLDSMVSSQTVNLRKAVLKSDLIVEVTDYEYKENYLNDYTKQVSVELKKINGFLKNKGNNALSRLTAQTLTDGEDFYSRAITQRLSFELNPIYFGDNRPKYYNIFFLQKKGKTYHLFLALRGLEEKDYTAYCKQIKTVPEFENISNPQNRFEKTLDWFIDNGLKPDDDFIQYWTKNGKITSDDIPYSTGQYQKLLTEFKNGNEDYYFIVKDKYKAEVKAYYLENLENIIASDAGTLTDYFRFQEIVYNLTDYFVENYDPLYKTLTDSLNSDQFTDDQKLQFMRYLVQILKDRD